MQPLLHGNEAGAGDTFTFADGGGNRRFALGVFGAVFITGKVAATAVDEGVEHLVLAEGAAQCGIEHTVTIVDFAAILATQPDP